VGLHVIRRLHHDAVALIFVRDFCHQYHGQFDSIMMNKPFLTKSDRFEDMVNDSKANARVQATMLFVINSP
jgi:tRNA1(Val) A37 N6-methylase TrmN6